MYEDDEFARSLGVVPETQIFAPDDSDMMNMIFQYLETDDPVKEVETEPPRLNFRLSTVPDIQRYRESSQESSPSPTTSLFSESHTASRASGLTTPRTLSNSSLRSQRRSEQGDELRMTTKPTNNLLVVKNEHPKIPSPRSSEYGILQEEVGRQRTRSPQASPTATNCCIQDVPSSNPQEKRKSSFGDLNWSSLSAITSKYERRGSKEKSYRHASGARLDELEELGQAIMPSINEKYKSFVYAPSQESKTSYDNSQRPSQEFVPPYPVSSHDVKPPNSPSTFQNINHPQPPPTDPSMRRYESFKMAAGKYELKVYHNDLPRYEGRTKGLDTLPSPKPSLRSRFSFPKPLRATITSFVDTIPHSLLPSPPITPPEQSVSLPTRQRIPTPDFSTPPRPAPQPLPALLSVGFKDTRTVVPTPVSHAIPNFGPTRSFSGRSSASKASAPSLTIKIPESKRPAPQKVDNVLTDALEKWKQASLLARPAPQPKLVIEESPAMPSRQAPLAPVTAQQKPVESLKYPSELQPKLPTKSPRRYQLQDAAIVSASDYAVQAPPVLNEVPLAQYQARLQELLPRPLNTQPKTTPSPTFQTLPKNTYKPSPQPSLPHLHFHTAFLTPNTGLQMHLSRLPSTLSTLTWSISTTATSPTSQNISCTTNPHSLTRQSNFYTSNGEEIFSLQKKIGSTRVAEISGGGRGELFTVRDLGFEGCGWWIVEFVEEGENGGRGMGMWMGMRERWIVRGDERDGVQVECEGVEVGRIGVKRGHDYMVDVKPGMNYAVMVALVTVFDDWRMDHCC